MLLNIILVIAWFLLGVYHLLEPRISRFSYFCCWICLILNLIARM